MEKKLGRTSLKINFIFNTVLQILSTIAPLITAPYISRILGPENIGIYSYTLSINSYFVLIAGLGTASYGIVEIAKVRDSTFERSKTFWGIELITVLTSILSLFMWLFVVGFYKEYRVIFLIQSLYILSAAFDVSWFYLGIEKLKYTVIINSFFKIVGVFCIFLFIKSKNDLSFYIFILSISTFLGNVSMWLFLPKYILFSKVKVVDLKEHFKGTFIYFIPTIAATIYSVVDKTLIGVITQNNVEIGYYEQATKIIGMIRTISFTSINTLFSSRMSYLFSKKQEDEIHSRLNFSLEFILTLSLGAFFGIAAISRCFVPIFFGDGYSKVIIFLILMSPLIPIMGISSSIGYLYYNPSGNRKKSSNILIIGTIINCVLNVFFIKLYSGNGAIIASLIAESIITGLYIVKSNGYVTFAMLFRIIYKKIIAGTVMVVFVYLLSCILELNISALLIQVVCGGIIYYAILIILHDSFITDITNKFIHFIRRKSQNEF